MKKFIGLAILFALFSFAPAVFAGGEVSGEGTVRLEECAAGNLLILAEREGNTAEWPYRVKKPDYCIHIYPDDDAVHKFYYTLSKEARLESGYYTGDQLAVLDLLKDGDRIRYTLSITGGEEGAMTYLINKASIKRLLERISPLTGETTYPLGIQGFGVVRLEECLKDNLLILGEGAENTPDWSYRVEKPDHCIHIYPTGKDYPHKMFYTLPKEARLKTGYYSEKDQLAVLDAKKDGDEIRFVFGVTLNEKDNCYTSGKTGDIYLINDHCTTTIVREWDSEVKVTVIKPAVPQPVLYRVNETPAPKEEPTPAPVWTNITTKTTVQESQPTSITTETREAITVKRAIPPAGFEDEVITAFDDYDNPFPDTDTGVIEGKAAAELYRRAVLGGYPDGRFKGSKEVNRAEAAKFLLQSRFGDTEESAGNGGFPDVLAGQWYAKFVIKAAKKGIIAGHPSGHFKPADTVNTAEFLKMLSKTFSLPENLPYSYSDVSSDAWFAKYAGIARSYNLFPRRTSRLDPAKTLTRDEVAVAIYQYLTNRDSLPVDEPVIAEPPKDYTGAIDDDPILGNVNALVTIIEFSDYECPYCARFSTQTLPQIKTKYIDTGKVRLIYRDFPLPFHVNAKKAAIAAECVGKQGGDKMYFEYHDLISANYKNLSTDNLKQWAAGLVPRSGEFNQCLDNDNYADEVEKDIADGKILGIAGTPSFLINGRSIVGAQSLEIFEEAIEKALSSLE